MTTGGPWGHNPRDGLGGPSYEVFLQRWGEREDIACLRLPGSDVLSRLRRAVLATLGPAVDGCGTDRRLATVSGFARHRAAPDAGCRASRRLRWKSRLGTRRNSSSPPRKVKSLSWTCGRRGVCLACASFPIWSSCIGTTLRDVVCISFNLDYSGAAGETPNSFREPVKEFLTKQGATFLNVISSDPADDVFQRLKLVSIPAVLVYGRDGQLAKRFDNDDALYGEEGFTYEKHIVPLVEQLLGTGGNPPPRD